MAKRAASGDLFESPEQTKTPKPRKRTTRRANDLDGKRWLINSISVWSDIRKNEEETALGHPAIFPSMLVERFIETFTTSRQKVILDPFVGSGSTILAATRLSKLGIGIDSNPKYVALTKRRLAKSASLFDDKENKPKCTIHTGDARQLLSVVTPNSVDLTITSPPYWDILNQARTADSKEVRHYGNLERDLGTIKDYREFIDTLQTVFEQVFVAMRPERYCIVIVMDLRKKDRFFPFHSDVAQMMERAGYVYDDLIIWNRQAEYNNLRPLGYPSVFRVNKVHEFCLVFKTPGRKDKNGRDKRILAK